MKTCAAASSRRLRVSCCFSARERRRGRPGVVPSLDVASLGYMSVLEYSYVSDGGKRVSAQAGSVKAKQARPASVDAKQDEQPKGILARLRRAGMVAVMSVVGLNIWTGNPLLALWVGSRVVGAQGTISMGAVALVAVM